MKHLPLGRTNLKGLSKPVFSTGFTGTSNPSITSESQNGKPGSIFAEVISDIVRFDVFFFYFGFALGTTVAVALGLMSGCTSVSQRSIAASLVVVTRDGSCSLVTVVAAAHGPPTNVLQEEVLDEQVEADDMGTGVLPPEDRRCDQVTVVAAASHGPLTRVLWVGVLDEQVKDGSITELDVS